MRLVLWDIDGTLVQAGNHGRMAFADAFGRVFGRPTDIDDLPMSGRTDHAICLELLERNGVTGGEEHLPAMFDALNAALVERRDAMAADGDVMPGVPEALEALGDRDDVHQSLLTGNIEANAHVKLGAFGLDRLVDMEVGGYGSDSGIRPELVDVAREKAARLRGIDVEARDTVLIGDTPLDVHAAHVNGARAIALATGSFGSVELRATGAEAVLEDASDLAALIDAVLG
ncbi:MAG: haloacid dehalogenase-like hydrolase [Thermoleophilaceae bacterium]